MLSVVSNKLSADKTSVAPGEEVGFTGLVSLSEKHPLVPIYYIVYVDDEETASGSSSAENTDSASYSFTARFSEPGTHSVRTLAGIGAYSRDWYSLDIEELEIQAVPVKTQYITLYDVYLYMKYSFQDEKAPAGAPLYVNNVWVGGLYRGSHMTLCIRLTDYLDYASKPSTEYDVEIQVYDENWRLNKVFRARIVSVEKTSHC